ncbi:hypothetical protein V2I01_05765 [Micromonospora sp. BRA006-A]|nr:hypothetical protein [Micromonospora sp. BRA006-A]
MTEPDYSLAKIRVMEFDDSVRERPGMYFGVGRHDPCLATRVLLRGRRTRVSSGSHCRREPHPDVVAEITADLTFSVTDDQTDVLTGRGTPKLGYYGSLLTSERWSSAAAAAVSSQTTVEVWRHGHGFRQRLVGLRPVEPPAEFSAPVGAGTRVAFVLDPAYFGSAAITTDIASLDVHGPACTNTTGSGKVVIRDRRGRSRPNEYRCA